MRFASATATREARGESRSEQYRRLIAGTSVPAPDGPTVVEAAAAAELVEQGDFLGWVKAKGLNLPTETGALLTEANAMPDYVYRQPGTRLAVFVDLPDTEQTALRDEDAEERLFDAGWEAVRFRPGDDWDALAGRYADCFGDPTTN